MQTPKNITIFGTNGAIGQALAKELQRRYPKAQLHKICRSSNENSDDLVMIDDYSEPNIKKAVLSACAESPLDLVLVAIGQLHQDDMMPEKSLQQLNQEQLLSLIQVNTVTPALIAKHCLPRMNKQGPAVFAALSARVGSISDNRLGGWYSYRISKAGLNMLIKTASIEHKRTHPRNVVVGLHPGTVESQLSEPFLRNVPKEKLFSPAKSAKYLVNVIESLNAEQTGLCFDWQGEEIPA